MNKYLLFAGCDFDARGGWDDFIASRDTLSEIKDVLMELRCVPPENMRDHMPARSWSFDWYQIVERDTLQRYEVRTVFQNGVDVLAEVECDASVASTSSSARRSSVNQPLNIDLLLTEDDLYAGDLPTTRDKGEYLSLWIDARDV